MQDTDAVVDADVLRPELSSFQAQEDNAVHIQGFNYHIRGSMVDGGAIDKKLLNDFLSSSATETHPIHEDDEERM